MVVRRPKYPNERIFIDRYALYDDQRVIFFKSEGGELNKVFDASYWLLAQCIRKGYFEEVSDG